MTQLRSPCQAVIPVRTQRGRPTEDDRLCGEPSWFRYRGVPPTKQPGQRSLERCEMVLCPDHAKGLAQDFMAWTIHDSATTGRAPRPISIERLDMVVHRFHCKTCQAFTGVVWDTAAPAFNPGAFQFCPRCGARSNAYIDPEADYWDVMSQAFDNMPVLLLKMLYTEWDRVKFNKFRDYVDWAIKEFDATGDIAT